MDRYHVKTHEYQIADQRMIFASKLRTCSLPHVYEKK